MSKISFVTRKVNANGDVSVNVRHTHNGSTFQKSTGVTIQPEFFSAATGKVSKVSNSPELNQQIQGVVSDIETAVRNLGKVTPTKEALDKAYSEVLAVKEMRKETVPQAKRILGRMLDVLRAELSDLEKQVELKKAEIKAEEQMMGIHPDLVSAFATQYANSKKATAAETTVASYEYVATQVSKFNPLWIMKEVNPTTLRDLENYLIDAGFKNLTITDVISKLKTIVYYYAKQLELDVADIRTFKTNVKKKTNPNVVYLTKEELNDLIALELTNPNEIEARDRFVLMSLCGMRLSDSNIKPENVINGELVFSTAKTDTDLVVPISSKVNEILERYNNTIPTTTRGAFNRIIKRICSKVESLNHTVEMKAYQGKNKPTKTAVKKWSVVSAHVGRKTFINLALIAGTNPVTIAGLVGHSGTDLIMNTYGNREAGKEQLKYLLD
jgi:integrase